MIVERGRTWRNWGRSQSAHPSGLVRATGVADVQEAIALARRDGTTLKTVGAGHSFTAIAATEGMQLDISAIDGVLAVEGTEVTLGAGTNLFQLPTLLGAHGLALENMGDIDKQTIAGAISTGTHGTGASFGGIATQVVAATIVTAAGATLRVSPTENAELLPAVRVGLGALGVLVDVTLRCVPEFMVNAIEKPEPLEGVLEEWEARASAVDHFEFYWFPHTTSALTKSNTRMPPGTPRATQNPVAAWIDDELLPNGIYPLLCEFGMIAPGSVPTMNRVADKLVAARDITDGWHSVFTSPRRVRFREMEYALPVAAVPEALREVQALIDRENWRITFPVEVRVAASDENWLSTAYGRESGYIAVHRYYREDPTEYFAGVEAIMRAHEGRPHWGKMHTRTADDLRPAYPRFDDFLAVRDRLDPDRLFANDYLRAVLGS